MLEQQELIGGPSRAKTASTRPDADAAIPLPLLQQIEDSLDRRFALMGDSMTLEVRQKHRAEMRDHLYVAIRAHMELGSPPEEAIAAALLHVGDVGTIIDTETHERLRRLPSARLATILSVPLFGVPWLADNRQWAAHLWERWVCPFAESDPAKAATEAAFYRFELLVVPLLAGLLVGLLARHRAVRGVLNGLALLTIPALLCPGFMLGLGYAGILPQGTEMNWLPSPVPAVVGLTYWVGMGCLGAFTGSRMRRFSARLFARRRYR